MSKQILLVHGRSIKPAENSLRPLWVETLRAGLERDRGDKVDAFDAATVRMVYYGDLSNKFLHDARPKEYPNPAAANFDKDLVAGRRMTLDALKQYKADEFSKKTYDRLPKKDAKKEFFADLLAGPAAALRLGSWAISKVAPDMAEYWSDEREFGSAVRQRMIAPLRQAFDSGQPVCVIAHSLGTLISYDTLWKFSRYGEYRGDLTNGVNYNDVDKYHVDLLMTLGSPLGDETVKSHLKGRASKGAGRYPGNIRRWGNVAAEDDYISHDGTLADDFAEIVGLGLVKHGLHDEHIYNPSVTGDPAKPKDHCSNPHHEAGYLIHPQVIRHLADFL